MTHWLFLDGSLLNNGIQALCRTLIHSLWQGLLLTIAAGIVMLLTKKASAAIRYTIITGLFFIFLAATCTTFIYEWGANESPDTSSIANTFYVTTVLQDYGLAHIPAAIAQYCSDNATLIVMIWFAFFSFKCLRIGQALLYTHRIRTRHHQEADIHWQNKMSALARMLRLKKTVKLLESGITKVPVVIGHLKPIIYMPAGLITNLPPEQIEAVLMHELAHIRRNDYFINLVQNIAETIFFFNPGLLWVSSIVKLEREHCCDDIALEHTQKKKQFIEALIRFKEHAVYGSTYTTAFPGRKNQLLQRVTRIIHNRNNPLNGLEKIFFLVSVLVSTVLFAAIGNRKDEQFQSVDGVMEKHASVSSHGPVYTISVNNSITNTTLATITVNPGKKITPTKPQYTEIQKDALAMNEVTEVLPVMQDMTGKYRQLDKDQDQTEKHQQQMIRDKEQTDKNYLQAIRDREQAEKDRQQAIRDQEQAARDRVQAEKDREQAEHDRGQAEKDRQQADRDKQQAELDRRQADQDRQQAQRDREQADKDRIQADKDREQAERDRMQADKDRIQAERDRRQTDRVKMVSRTS